MLGHWALKRYLGSISGFCGWWFQPLGVKTKNDRSLPLLFISFDTETTLFCGNFCCKKFGEKVRFSGFGFLGSLVNSMKKRRIRPKECLHFWIFMIFGATIFFVNFLILLFLCIFLGSMVLPNFVENAPADCHFSCYQGF